MFVPDFNATKSKIREEIKPVIIEEREIGVTFSDLTNTGLMRIDFSDKVGLPQNLTSWSSQNEGVEYFDIGYLPNNKS